MGEVMRTAAFSLTEAKFAMGDINHLVLQNVSKAQVRVRTKKDNVAGSWRTTQQMCVLHLQHQFMLSVSGVSLPIFEHYTDGADSEIHRLWSQRICPSFFCILQVTSWLGCLEADSRSTNWRKRMRKPSSCWSSWRRCRRRSSRSTKSSKSQTDALTQ